MKTEQQGRNPEQADAAAVHSVSQEPSNPSWDCAYARDPKRGRCPLSCDHLAHLQAWLERWSGTTNLHEIVVNAQPDQV